MQLILKWRPCKLFRCSKRGDRRMLIPITLPFATTGVEKNICGLRLFLLLTSSKFVLLIMEFNFRVLHLHLPLLCFFFFFFCSFALSITVYENILRSLKIFGFLGNGLLSLKDFDIGRSQTPEYEHKDQLKGAEIHA